jgi:hypothetical protein
MGSVGNMGNMNTMNAETRPGFKRLASSTLGPAVKKKRQVLDDGSTKGVEGGLEGVSIGGGGLSPHSGAGMLDGFAPGALGM